MKVKRKTIYQVMLSDIFIVYEGEDRARAHEILKALQKTFDELDHDVEVNLDFIDIETSRR